MKIDEDKSPNQTMSLVVMGWPGIGKSEIIKQIKDECGYKHFVDIRLGQHDSTDVKGILYTTENENGKKVLRWIQPEFMPLEGSLYDDGEPGILFFDEINRGQLEILQSVFEAIHDRRIGMRNILKNWFIVAAGNLGFEDGTDVIQMDSALLDRFQVVQLEKPTFHEWKDNFAEPKGVHPIVIDFLSNYPDYLYFVDDGFDKMVTPRRWDRWSQELKKHPGKESYISELMSSTFLYNLSIDFNAFARDYNHIHARDIFDRFDNIKNDLEKLDRHEIVDLMENIDQYIKNTPVNDVSGFSKFFKTFLTEDDKVSMIVRLCSNEAGIVVVERFLKANPDINNESPKLMKRIEEELSNR